MSEVLNPLMRWKNPNFIAKSAPRRFGVNKRVAARHRGKSNKLALPKPYYGRVGGVAMRSYYGDGIPVIESIKKALKEGKDLMEDILRETAPDYSEHAAAIAQAKRENNADAKKEAQDKLLKFCTEQKIDPSKDEQVQALLAM